MKHILILLLSLSCIDRPVNKVVQNTISQESNQARQEENDVNDTSIFNNKKEEEQVVDPGTDSNNTTTLNLKTPMFDGLKIKDFSGSTTASLLYKSTVAQNYVKTKYNIIDDTLILNYFVEVNNDYDKLSLPVIWSSSNILETTTNPNSAKTHMYFYADQIVKFLKKHGTVFDVNKHSLTFNFGSKNYAYTQQNGSVTKMLHIPYIDEDKNIDLSLSLMIFVEGLITNIREGDLLDLGSSNSLLATKHKTCGYSNGPKYKYDCCKDKMGCSKAITRGIAHYMVALLFKEAPPSIGDALSGNALGRMLCKRRQNLTDFDIEAQLAYSECSEKGKPGDLSAMGALFGSILMKVYEDTGIDKDVFHKMLIHLLANLSASDGFVEVYNHLKSISKSGEPTSLILNKFKAEFSRRGISVN